MILVVVCGYECEQTLKKCALSIKMQTFKDVTLSLAISTKDNRKYLVENTVIAIDRAKLDDNDIICCIDADDFLIDECAFDIVNSYYAENPELLLTYGSYVNLSTNKPGKFVGSYTPGENFRTAPWRASHLKTFKYKLWNKLAQDNYSQLLDENGLLFKCCADRAMMIPMMEMAGHDRIAHIPMLMYCYNDQNPLSVWNTMKDESVRTRNYISDKKPLKRIDRI